MTMKTHFAATLIAVVTSVSLAGAVLAANGTTPLGDCYNRVIAICNQGAHPIPCAENAMDGCDEVYGNATVDLGTIKRFKTPEPTPNPARTFTLRR